METFPLVFPSPYIAIESVLMGNSFIEVFFKAYGVMFSVVSYISRSPSWSVLSHGISPLFQKRLLLLNGVIPLPICFEISFNLKVLSIIQTIQLRLNLG